MPAKKHRCDGSDGEMDVGLHPGSGRRTEADGRWPEKISLCSFHGGISGVGTARGWVHMSWYTYTRQVWKITAETSEERRSKYSNAGSGARGCGTRNAGRVAWSSAADTTQPQRKPQ